MDGQLARGREFQEQPPSLVVMLGRTVGRIFQLPVACAQVQIGLKLAHPEGKGVWFLAGCVMERAVLRDLSPSSPMCALHTQPQHIVGGSTGHRYLLMLCRSLLEELPSESSAESVRGSHLSIAAFLCSLPQSRSPQLQGQASGSLHGRHLGLSTWSLSVEAAMEAGGCSFVAHSGLFQF